MKKLLPLIVACCLPTGTLASPLVGTWQADATALLTPGCTDFCPEQVTMTATFSEDSRYTLDILFDYEGDLWASLTEDGTDLSSLGLPAMETYEIRVAGTYEDNGSTFAVTVSEHRGLVNRGDAVEFYTKAGRILARALADEAGIPEEDYDAFEARFLEDFLSGPRAADALPDHRRHHGHPRARLPEDRGRGDVRHPGCLGRRKGPQMTHQKAELYDVLAPAGPGDLLTARPRVAPEGRRCAASWRRPRSPASRSSLCRWGRAWPPEWCRSCAGGGDGPGAWSWACGPSSGGGNERKSVLTRIPSEAGPTGG